MLSTSKSIAVTITRTPCHNPILSVESVQVEMNIYGVLLDNLYYFTVVYEKSGNYITGACLATVNKYSMCWFDYAYAISF